MKEILANIFSHVRGRLLGFSALCSIPVLLAVIHAGTTASTRASLAFYLNDPSLPAMWTQAAVHYSWAHLRSNMLAYIFTTVMTYAIYIRWQRERTMWIIFGAILLITPLVQSVTDYLLLKTIFDRAYTEYYTMGFSGVVGAYLGMLIATISAYISDRTNSTVGFNVLLTFILLSFAVVLSEYPPSGHKFLASVVLLVIGLGLTLGKIVGNLGVQGISGARKGIAEESRDIQLLWFSTVVVLFFVTLLFPGNPEAGEMTTNILAHLTGLFYGMFATSILVRIL